MAAYAAHTTDSSTRLLTARKWRFRQKEARRMGLKKRKGYDKNSGRTRQKNKRGNMETWDQTGSPEIPDMGETSEMPGLPSGGRSVQRQRCGGPSTSMVRRCDKCERQEEEEVYGQTERKAPRVQQCRYQHHTKLRASRLKLLIKCTKTIN